MVALRAIGSAGSRCIEIGCTMLGCLPECRHQRTLAAREASACRAARAVRAEAWARAAAAEEGAALEDQQQPNGGGDEEGVEMT